MSLLYIALYHALQNPRERVFETPVLPQYYQPPSKRPCLSLVSSKVDVSSNQSKRLELLLPIDYSGQTIISLDVSATPSDVIKSWRLQGNADGLNRALLVQLTDRSIGSRVTYRCRILTPGEEVIRTKRKDFNLWKSPSKLINSNDPSIKALAQDLKSSSSDLDQFVQKVVKYVASDQKAKSDLIKRQDSTVAPDLGNGSLRSACLCAAMLRSQGIAARAIRYCPTWAPVGNTDWWLTEYESDGGNWEMVDPTIGIVHVNRNSVIVLEIPDLARENAMPDHLGQTIDVKTIQFFPGQAAAKVMSSGYRRSLKVTESAKKGKNDWLDDKTFDEARMLGPTNFALFLDGRPIMPRKPSPVR